jgi:VanZ family protein
MLVRLLACAYVLAIIFLSLAPRTPMGGVRVNDKLQHAGAYLVMSVLVFGSLSPSMSLLRRLVIVLIACTLLGVGIELVQPATGRSADVGDAIANAGGAAMGCLMVLAVRAMGQKLMPKPARR